ncbi:hypothetical protein VTK56DRAFT_6645 [Thermocarpiscus australiensis]
MIQPTVQDVFWQDDDIHRLRGTNIKARFVKIDDKSTKETERFYEPKWLKKHQLIKVGSLLLLAFRLFPKPGQQRENGEQDRDNLGRDALVLSTTGGVIDGTDRDDLVLEARRPKDEPKPAYVTRLQEITAFASFNEGVVFKLSDDDTGEDPQKARARRIMNSFFRDYHMGNGYGRTLLFELDAPLDNDM